MQPAPPNPKRGHAGARHHVATSLNQTQGPPCAGRSSMEFAGPCCSVQVPRLRHRPLACPLARTVSWGALSFWGDPRTPQSLFQLPEAEALAQPTGSPIPDAPFSSP